MPATDMISDFTAGPYRSPRSVAADLEHQENQAAETAGQQYAAELPYVGQLTEFDPLGLSPQRLAVRPLYSIYEGPRHETRS